MNNYSCMSGWKRRKRERDGGGMLDAKKKKRQMRVEPEGVEERERGMMNVRGTGMRDGAA